MTHELYKRSYESHVIEKGMDYELIATCPSKEIAVGVGKVLSTAYDWKADIIMVSEDGTKETIY